MSGYPPNAAYPGGQYPQQQYPQQQYPQQAGYPQQQYPPQAGYPQLPPGQPQWAPSQPPPPPPPMPPSSHGGYAAPTPHGGYTPQGQGYAAAPQFGGAPPGYQAQYAQAQPFVQAQPQAQAQRAPQAKVVDAYPSYGAQPVPVAAAAPQPVAQPVVSSGWRDVGFMVFFWLHVLGIAGLAFALGVPAVVKDMAKADTAGRSPLDFNAALFFKVLLVACVVGAVASAAFILILKRFASSLIYCALYTSLVLQAVFTALFFAIGQVIMGIVMLVLFALQCAYVYWVRDRIAFATAHVKAAVNAVEAHRAVYGVALALVFLQMAWVLVWELASLGVSSAVNSSAAAAAGASNATAAMGAPSNGGGSNGSSLGGAAVFGMTVSLYWGTQTFMYASHFIVASVVGSWWFTPKAASPVAAATHRAFTSSFGSLSFGALIVAVLEACKQLARAAQEAARIESSP